MSAITSRHFRIGTGMPGAVSADLTLHFSDDGDVSGNAMLKQSTNPPLNMASIVTGHDASYSNIAGITQIISLTGISDPPLMPLAYQNLRATIVLHSYEPGTGTAELQYRPVSGPWMVLKDLPVTVDELVAA
jgi:hypothetical protein